MKKLPASAAPVKKRAATAKAAAAPAKKPSKKGTRRVGDAQSPGVRVRMYRQGLGDCFLVTFAPDSAAPFHMLIDCGLILGTPDPVPKMKQVAESIKEEVGVGGLDLLVATHEHWDHLSGFVQAHEIFSAIPVRKVWLGWTEDPTNPDAQRLRIEREQKLAKVKTSLAVVNQRFGVDPHSDQQPETGTPEGVAGRESRETLDLLSFFGVGADDLSATPLGLGVAKGNKPGIPQTTSAAMEWLQQKQPEYRTPADPPLTFPEVPGVRFYVLGPPTDLKALRKDMPTKSGKEVYEMSPYEQAFFAAIDGIDPNPNVSDLYCPFDQRLRIPTERARLDPFFAKHYFGNPRSAGDHAERAEETEPLMDWRRIDAHWLSSLTKFALKLDSDTNNTSLALAIELPDGRVMLFPGDAQVGNWESWSGLKWTVDGREVTGPDLLRRTVLYKVGHHGSHNATLRERGLELMTSPDLVAMLPVDEQVAHEVKHWTKMPFQPLVARLEEKTTRRILRADHDESLIGDDVKKSKEQLKTSKGPHALYVDFYLS